MRVTKLCNSKDIAVVNGMFPGPVVHAQEGDRIVVNVTNATPFNITIHWYNLPLNTFFALRSILGFQIKHFLILHSLLLSKAWCKANTVLLVRRTVIHYSVSNSVRAEFYL